MRTTLDIEDDVLAAVRQLAAQQNTTAGRMVSMIVREAFRPKSFTPEYRNGVPLLPKRPGGPVVTSELVNRLRDEDE